MMSFEEFREQQIVSGKFVPKNDVWNLTNPCKVERFNIIKHNGRAYQVVGVSRGTIKLRSLHGRLEHKTIHLNDLM